MVQDQPKELYWDIVQWMPCPMMLCSAEGSILWCNKNFTAWAGYSSGELRAMKWHDLLAERNPEGAIREVASLNLHNPTYSPRTRMTPNQGAAAWGQLHVSRWPVDGDEVKAYWIVWEPSDDGGSAALTMAVDAAKKHAASVAELKSEIAELKQEIVVLMTTNPQEQWLISTFRMAGRYPKIALFIFGYLLVSIGTSGVSNIMTMARDAGLIPTTPVKVVPVVPAGSGDPGTAWRTVMGQDIAMMPVASKGQLVTVGGNQLTWETDDDRAVLRALRPDVSSRSRHGLLGSATRHSGYWADVRNEPIHGTHDGLRQLHDEPAVADTGASGEIEATDRGSSETGRGAEVVD